MSLLNEICVFFRLSAPIYLTALCTETIGIIPIVFAGQVGDQSKSLAAVALSQALINITGYFPLITLTSAVDRLFTKTNIIGRNKYTGLLLQRSFLVNTFLMLPIAFVWLNTENILILLRQPVEVTAKAGQYVMVYTAILPALCLSTVVVKTLQLQEVILPSLLIFLFANMLEIAVIYPLAYFTDIGVSAFALGPVVAFYFITIAHCVYLRSAGLWKRIWCGLTLEAWERWCEYTCYGLPLLLVNQLEIVSIHSGAFILGVLSYQPVVDIGIHIVAICINSFITISCMSLSLATSIRISQLSTYRQRRTIKKIIISSLCMTILLTLSQSALLACGSQIWGQIFSSDNRVSSGLSSILFLLAVYHPFEGLLILFQAVLNGLRKQQVNGLFTLLFFCVSFPLAILLVHFLTDKPFGYWAGIVSGYMTRTVLCVLLTIIFYTLVCTVSQSHSELTPLVEGDRIPQHTEMPYYLSTINRTNHLKWRTLMIKLLLLILLVLPFFPLLGCRYGAFKKDFYNTSYIQSPVELFCLRFLPFNHSNAINQTY